MSDHTPVHSTNEAGSGHTTTATHSAPAASGRRKPPGYVKPLIFLVVVVGGLAGSYKVFGHEKFMAGVELVKEFAGIRSGHHSKDAPIPKPESSWNGLVKVTKEEKEALGCRIIPVVEQTEPLTLELPAQTDYDLNTLNKVRPRFDNALVEKVHVAVGQSVKKGDPLLDLLSADLGQAKNDCRTAFVQYNHDKRYLEARRPLVRDGRITQKEWADTQTDEEKSRLTYFVSRDKLITYGMTNEQIDKMLENLGESQLDDKALQLSSTDITRITVVSPIDGIVVDRDAVPGNVYDQVNVMLTLSPMDVMWVWGNVAESDVEKVHLGQRWDIVITSTGEKFEGKIESIANELDPETRSLRIRASIPNPAKVLRKRMLARGYVKVPPNSNDTVIPRNALTVIYGEYYAFVEKARTETGESLFERRKLMIEQENSENVVVKKGLSKGEMIVANGALILSQLYEDQSTVETGMPAQ